ncbi:MAG TPA: c-type cytochrome [Pirellulales bacterium]|jgi:mono/diheme cytochrome c family protein|nr:c-type cytochrome [Pirellulales bacterium]
MLLSWRNIRGLCLAMLLAALPLAVGCSNSGPPQFHANLVQLVDNNVSEKHQQQIADILLAMYGTPDDPFVLSDTGLDLQKLRVAAGPVKGYSQGLFRLHCVHCHGITGDGMGPTALFLKPYPRDYREGWFKFKSTPSNQPPTHADLVRTLKEGIPGTAMPSFKLLSQGEIESLVEYVEYLSMRGQTELALIAQYKTADEFDPDKEDFPTTRKFLVDTVLNAPNGPATLWKGAATQATAVPTPPQDFGSAVSIEAGKQVFYGKGACVKCHGPTALGDGQLVWDMWSEAIHKMDIKIADSTDPSKFSELSHALRVDALPPRAGEPRNLRAGILRGGRAPYELFYRLNNGIFPSQMPGIGTTPGMTTDDIWHLIDFILDLPYEPGSQYHTDEHMKAPPRELL